MDPVLAGELGRAGIGESLLKPLAYCLLWCSREICDSLITTALVFPRCTYIFSLRDEPSLQIPPLLPWQSAAAVEVRTARRSSTEET